MVGLRCQVGHLKENGLGEILSTILYKATLDLVKVGGQVFVVKLANYLK